MRVGIIEKQGFYNRLFFINHCAQTVKDVETGCKHMPWRGRITNLISRKISLLLTIYFRNQVEEFIQFRHRCFYYCEQLIELTKKFAYFAFFYHTAIRRKLEVEINLDLCLKTALYALCGVFQTLRTY